MEKEKLKKKLKHHKKQVKYYKKQLEKAENEPRKIGFKFQHSSTK